MAAGGLVPDATVQTTNPTRAVALWTSSPAQEVALFDPGADTLFVGALCEALEAVDQLDTWLSLRETHEVVRKLLAKRPGRPTAIPQMQELNQGAESLLDVPLFPFDSKSTRFSPRLGNRIDLSRPIEVRRTRRRERLDGIDRIDNLAIHPSGDYFSFSLDEDLFLEKLSDTWPVQIGRHSVADPSGQLQLRFEQPTGPGVTDHSLGTVRGVVQEHVHDMRITATAFSPRGDLILSADLAGFLVAWSVDPMLQEGMVSSASGQRLVAFQPHDDAIMSVAFAPFGDRVATAGFDEVIRVWDVDRLIAGHTDSPFAEFRKRSRIRRKARYQHDIEQIQSMAFSRSGAQLASGDQQGVIVVRELYSQVEFYRQKVHNGAVRDLCFSPRSDSLLVSASDDTRIRSVDFALGAEASTIGVKDDKHRGGVNSIAFSDNGELLVSSSSDGWIKLWNVQDKSLVASVKGATEHAVDKVAFFPKRDLLASDAALEDISIWEVANHGEFTSTEFRSGND